MHGAESLAKLHAADIWFLVQQIEDPTSRAMCVQAWHSYSFLAAETRT